MSRLHLAFLLVLSVALSGTLFAKDHDDKKHDRDRDHDRDHRVHVRHDHERDHDRRRDIRVHHDEHGKKVGWGDCDVPPGQAKKVGCHSDREHHVRVSHRRHDRDDHRTVVVRHDHDRDRRRHRRSAAVPVHTNTATAPRPAPITRNPNAHPGAGVAGGADVGRRAPVKTVQQ